MEETTHRSLTMKTWTLQNFYLSYILAIICKYTQNTLVRMCHVTANCMLLMKYAELYAYRISRLYGQRKYSSVIICLKCIDRSHRNVWRNFSRLFERKPHPLVGKIGTGFTTGGRGEDILLREYVDSLDGVAKSRYFDKLKVLGLAATDNPYASSDFQNAMRLWPPVEFGHIFCYFIERPGVYTRQELLQWKII